MIDEYEGLLYKVEEAFRTIGFFLEATTEYETVFSDGGDWRLTFEGDRFLPLTFDLLVGRLVQGKKLDFSVRILMKVFQEDLRPSLENQLEFIVCRRFELMPDFDIPYKIEYDRINSIY